MLTVLPTTLISITLFRPAADGDLADQIWSLYSRSLLALPFLKTHPLFYPIILKESDDRVRQAARAKRRDCFLLNLAVVISIRV